MPSQHSQHGADEFKIISFVENGIKSKIYDVIQKNCHLKFTMEVTSHQWHRQGSADPKLKKHHITKSKFLSQLRYTFQTKTRNYFILTHMNKENSLSRMMETNKILTETETRFVLTEIITALEALHNAGVTYGCVTIEDIFFDSEGHIILKRIFCGQTYWTKDECYNCEIGNCDNSYHKGLIVTSAEITKDWVSAGKLLVQLLTGKNTEEHDQQLTSKLASDLSLQLTKKHVFLRNIKRHPFLDATNWEMVQRKENKVPLIFKRHTRQVQLNISTLPSIEPDKGRSTKENINNLEHKSTNDYFFENFLSRSSTYHPSANQCLLVGKRKVDRKRSIDYIIQTARSARANGMNRHTKLDRPTVLSIGEEPKPRDFNDGFLHKTEKYTDRSIETLGINSTEKPASKESLSRTKSIKGYIKRLEEISKVLERNRKTVELTELNNIGIKPLTMNANVRHSK